MNLTKKKSLALLGSLIFTVSMAGANLQSLVKISQDPYTDVNSGQHSTEVEPMLATHGKTIVAAFQVARFEATGAENIGYSTSIDGGITWKKGVLSGTTTFAGGTAGAVSLPVVVYNEKFSEYLISFVAYDSSGNSIGEYVVQSHDGVTWSQPILAGVMTDSDKSWIACDNNLTSPYFGNCYAVWIDYDDYNNYFITSKDGGKTWSQPINSPDADTGGSIGGMVVQPNGHVILVGTFGGILGDQNYSLQSVDGGKTLQTSVNIFPYSFNPPGQGAMRADPFPTVGVDAKGEVYAVFADCSFRANCATNDLVITTTTDGLHWSAIQRIPIDAVTSGADHFITGLGVNNTGGLFGIVEAFLPTRLALSYYFFPNGNCDINSCQLYAGFISSNDGGKTWSKAETVAGPMSLNSLAVTGAGQMVANNISAVFYLGQPFSAFALAQTPNAKTGQLNEAIYATKLPSPFGW